MLPLNPGVAELAPVVKSLRAAERAQCGGIAAVVESNAICVRSPISQDSNKVRLVQ